MDLLMASNGKLFYTINIAVLHTSFPAIGTQVNDMPFSC